MKTQDEIENVLMHFDQEESNYRGMTFEQGIEEALRWVLGDIEDKDFAAFQHMDHPT